MIGWSDGSNSALKLAIKYPSRVDKVVVLAAFTHLNEKGIQAFLSTAEISYWEKEKRERYEAVYGADFKEIWADVMEFVRKIKQYFPGDFYDKKLPLVQCPVLILHGDKDPLLELEQAAGVAKQIPDSRLERFPNGGHNLHQQYPEKFKILAEDFLDE